MKKSMLFLMTAIAGFSILQASAITISFSGFMFTPMIDTIKTTDTVNFTLNSSHNAQEVSQATYTAKGTTALSGGFSVPFAGGKLVATGLSAGNHYYVCTNHASLGMEGILFVNASTAIDLISKNATPFTFQIAGGQPIAFNISGESAKVTVLDINGRSVFSINMGKNGFHNLAWDGKLSNGSNLAKGTYFVRVIALDAAQKPVSQISKTLVELH